jgi:diadenylate cyclase
MFRWISTALHFEVFKGLAVVDVLDILILGAFIYWIIRMLRGTRAVPAMVGVFAVVLVHFLTGPGLFHLQAVHSALGYLLLYLPFAVIVLFQNPIRQALSKLGWSRLAEIILRRSAYESLAEEVALAAASLASKQTGALIVVERKLGLRAFYETGIALDALVSYDLLMNLFMPGSPLHDGAVIIAEDRIKAASCYLPLTTNPDLSRNFGTRHRAAIGITEESDALAVVVSEERGVISLAESGRIVEDLDAHGLTERLVAALDVQDDGSGQARRASETTTDSGHA